MYKFYTFLIINEFHDNFFNVSLDYIFIAASQTFMKNKHKQEKILKKKKLHVQV